MMATKEVAGRLPKRYYDSKVQRESTWLIALTFITGCLLGATIVVGVLA
jgi:hypothetical protein